MGNFTIYESVEHLYDEHRIGHTPTSMLAAPEPVYDAWRNRVSYANLQSDSGLTDSELQARIQADSASTGGSGLMPEGDVRKILNEVIKEDEAVRNNKLLAPFKSKGLNVKTREYKQYRVTRNGHAVVYEGTSSDLGGNSINTDYITGKVVPIVTSITMDWFEEQAQAGNRFNLKSLLRDAANETLMDLVHELTFNAGAYSSYFHDLNTVPFVAQPVLSTTLGPGATGPVNAAAIQAILNERRQSSKQRYKFDTVDMGLDLMNTLESQPYDSSGMTLTTLEWLKKNNPGVTFRGMWELSADAQPDGRGRIVCQSRKAGAGLYTRLAAAPRALPTIHRGLEKTIPIFMLFGGIGCDKPLSVTVAEYNFA